MTSSDRGYSRPTLRKILKAHSRKRVATEVDPLVYLNYILFIEELMQTATRKALSDNNKNVTAKDIRKATMVEPPRVRTTAQHSRDTTPWLHPALPSSSSPLGREPFQDLPRKTI
ncbi:hypothetical protein AYO20_04151 [Fonsecaea nubica]|uniref:Transcription factor CBF/NF-Y/archaeal histone domain-containing protein n=1 Tax=Fonsecaea nubica TaxID=856822 RepID=A0A178D5Z7_9EURO|nr:hypothetical protein AYO20_04151 [Fonsecaea nubica]OAL36535.1 hypothetical protein AYO20_04151 [Fonsecaea nubica]